MDGGSCLCYNDREIRDVWRVCMYNEYVEVLVQRRVAGWTAVCRIILIVCTLVSLAAGVIFNPLLLIAAAVFFFLDLLIFPEMCVEYAYL